ncbi:MAG: NADH:ubiquinone oxidoreductase subunit 1 [Candidatus Alkanophagales archaeon MCA70_species_2]|nr:NADH:ubiquinone oxidoreductase subunit 1 [Candidatus Alkanophaga liquidiphilum]
MKMLGQILELASSNRVEIPLIELLLGMLPPPLSELAALPLWKPLFAALVVPGFATLGLLLLLLPWIERKLCARIQWRVGPKEIVSWLGGIIQLLADSLRFLFQEVIVSRDSHRPYFTQFVLLSFIPALLPMLFVAAGTIIAIRTEYSVQIMLALVCLFPVFILGMGWSSGNRFAFVGTVREAFMYFAYEVPLILSVIAMLLVFGTGDPVAIGESGRLGIVLNPLAALVFFIATAMGTSRLPFEIPEADQELAFGPFIEYSGITFGLAYVLAYEKLYVLSALFTTLFLGGGSGPMIAPLGELSGALWFVLKVIVVMVVFAALRAIYPRFRLDQALKAGWSSILAISLLAVIISSVEVVMWA